MKKALKIGAGIIGIGYVVWSGFLLGNAMPLATALINGKMEEANCISNNIAKTYGKDSFITFTILHDVEYGLNLGYKLTKQNHHLSYEIN